jgi:hypothetical protein
MHLFNTEADVSTSFAKKKHGGEIKLYLLLLEHLVNITEILNLRTRCYGQNLRTCVDALGWLNFLATRDFR